MKLLHTSDWHLGRTLVKKERQEEHVAFLEWLLTTIKENSVDLLLVAGDIFDNASPNSSSQKMYYDFLLKVRNAGCKNVIIVGGNHDSPSFLNAPKEILLALNVSVIGNVSNNLEDEIIIVKDNNDTPQAIVCAVPFLRERDISRFCEGENFSDRSKRIAESIKKHYDDVTRLAVNKQKVLGDIPIIATGHLSVTGGKTSPDDGVRETYIGNIEAVGSDIFPKSINYTALGHYHIPSVIKENIRYCGSPIPMGFGEAKQKKCVYLVDFNDDKQKIETIEIPVFQNIESIIGDKQFIENRLNELKACNKSVWIEIIYNGNDIFPDFTAWAAEQTTNTKIDILKLQNLQYLTEVLTLNDYNQSLNELDKFDVFDKLLCKNDISDEQKNDLKESYKDIVDTLNIGNEL